MKKLLFIVVIIATTLTISCSKDVTSPDGLVGTVWVGYSDGETVTLSFLTANNISMIYLEPGGYTDAEYGTYTYSHPTITIYFDGETTSGTVTGNSMSFFVEQRTVTFTKQ